MLKEIENILLSKQKIIDDWYKNKLEHTNPCFYTSVDLRFSGEKLVPVDTNLFPAGFNNISSEAIQKAADLAKNYFINLNYAPKSKILLLGESHDRNIYYQKNLKTIELILNKAGYIVKVADFNSALVKQNNLLQIDDFVPDLILLNNDLSAGIPEILTDIKQEIIPHPDNGWFKRRKSEHFSIYNQLIQELEILIGIPSYFFTTEFDVCDEINFKSQLGLEQLQIKTEEILNKIRNKYKQFQIKQKPYVVVKSDYGTYGMGIMIIEDSQEIFTMNKKLRNQMHITKNNVLNSQVIIQEGVKTIDKINSLSAEPLLYLVNNELVEFMYRVHESKNEYSNLNSVGMKIDNNYKSSHYAEYALCCNFVAKIASLAAALETK